MFRECRIDIKNSERIELENDKNRCLSSIKKLQKNIDLSIKSTFEIFIETISFGLISYDEKYDELNLKDKINITRLKNDIDDNLGLVIQEIRRLGNELEEKLTEFEQELIRFKNKLLSLAKGRYINDYTRVILVEELNQILQGYLLYQSFSLLSLVLFLWKPAV